MKMLGQAAALGLLVRRPEEFRVPSEAKEGGGLRAAGLPDGSGSGGVRRRLGKRAVVLGKISY
jgi:hypothetical protein